MKSALRRAAAARSYEFRVMILASPKVMSAFGALMLISAIAEIFIFIQTGCRSLSAKAVIPYGERIKNCTTLRVTRIKIMLEKFLPRNRKRLTPP